MTAPRLRWYVRETPAAAVSAALVWLRSRAEQALADRGEITVVLAGGATPRPLYEAASGLATDWRRWRFYFTDERCVPPGHPERNDVMARAAWLERAGVPPENVHSIPAELGAEAGAARYSETLADVGVFDVVVLGMGSDGHTASLFPGRPAGDEPESADALPVHEAPKPPGDRVSLSAARLSRTRAALLLVVGDGKREALRSVALGQDVPLIRVRPPHGIDVFADRAAAAAVPASVLED
ncbi:MAG TPA: 6-phosphogluconolactonase [Gammaproteobacteria bacterium]